MSQLRRKLSNCCCCRKPWLLKTLSGTWKETRRRLIVLTCMLEEFWRILCRKHAVLFRFSRVLHLLATRFPAYHTEWLHFSLRFALIGYTFSRAWHCLATCFLGLHTDWLHFFSRFALTGLTPHFAQAGTSFPALHADWFHVLLLFALTSYMFSRASHWLITCFPALCIDWLHVFPRFTLTGYTFSRASHLLVTGYMFVHVLHWLVTRFPAPDTDWLLVFPRFALGYTFLHSLVLFLFRLFQLFNGFVSLAPVTRFPLLGLDRIGQVLLNEFDFDLIVWFYDSRISLYHVLVSGSLKVIPQK